MNYKIHALIKKIQSLNETFIYFKFYYGQYLSIFPI